MNITGKFLKVWKVEEKNGFKKLDLGDSKKMKDGSYENWTWFGVTPVGNAKNVEVKEGDTIEIISGQISQRKYNDKWYNDLIIFEFEVTSGAKKAPTDTTFDPNDFDFDEDAALPWD